MLADGSMILTRSSTQALSAVDSSAAFKDLANMNATHKTSAAISMYLIQDLFFN